MATSESIAVQKPRISFSAFTAHLAANDAAPRPPMLAAGGSAASTVACILQRYMDEMNGTLTGKPIKPLGLSQIYTYGILIRSPHIGPKLAFELTKKDIIAHCDMRRTTPQLRRPNGVSGATVNQDVTFLSVALKYAGSAWDELDGLTDTAVTMAKPYLKKHGLISKSTPRDRRPQEEENEKLRAYFSIPPKRKNKKHIDMLRMMNWQLSSARRVGESCGLLWEDWDRDEHTIFVRKMKKQKNGKLVALPDAAQAMLEELWEIRNPGEPRIFPYRKESVVAAYCRAKKALGIVDLRLHDSRADKATRLVEDDGFSTAEAIAFTGHETVAVFERTYLRMKPGLLKLGPLSKRVQAAAANDAERIAA